MFTGDNLTKQKANKNMNNKKEGNYNENPNDSVLDCFVVVVFKPTDPNGSESGLLFLFFWDAIVCGKSI